MAEINRIDMKPKLTPTGTPIIKYKDKDGNSYMAREVKLETGDTCMAVSNVKNPSQATLMNNDVFQKTLQESLPEVPVQGHAGDTFTPSKKI